MKVSVTKAAKLANTSRTTLYTDMNNGKLSFHSDGKKKRTIDISELERVYGDLNIVNTEKVSSNVKTEQKVLTKDIPLTELAVLRERVKLIEEHTAREREQYLERIESLENALSKAQDGYNSITKLLEDKTSDNGAGELERSMKVLEDKINNQEKTLKSELEEARIKSQAQIARYKKELEAEKSKGFFQKLFG